jgi:hypothetical protein
MALLYVGAEHSLSELREWLSPLVRTPRISIANAALCVSANRGRPKTEFCIDFRESVAWHHQRWSRPCSTAQEPYS